MSDQEFNKGHMLEGVDRINTVVGLIEELLINHPAILKTGVNDDIIKAQSILSEAYQKVGMHGLIESFWDLADVPINEKVHTRKMTPRDFQCRTGMTLLNSKFKEPTGPVLITGPDEKANVCIMDKGDIMFSVSDFNMSTETI